MKIHWKKETLDYINVELRDSNIKYNDHWRFFERVGEFLISVTPRNKTLYRKDSVVHYSRIFLKTERIDNKLKAGIDLGGK